MCYTVFYLGAPCLSFDIIPDGLGAERSDFPHTAYLLSGTQASTDFTNRLIVMKMSNMQKTQPESDSEDSDDDDDDEDTMMKPDLECAIIHHQGSVNRVRVISKTLYILLLVIKNQNQNFRCV